MNVVKYWRQIYTIGGHNLNIELLGKSILRISAGNYSISSIHHTRLKSFAVETLSWCRVGEPWELLSCNPWVARRQSIFPCAFKSPDVLARAHTKVPIHCSKSGTCVACAPTRHLDAHTARRAFFILLFFFNVYFRECQDFVWLFYCRFLVFSLVVILSCFFLLRFILVAVSSSLFRISIKVTPVCSFALDYISTSSYQRNFFLCFYRLFTMPYFSCFIFSISWTSTFLWKSCKKFKNNT